MVQSFLILTYFQTRKKVEREMWRAYIVGLSKVCSYCVSKDGIANNYWVYTVCSYCFTVQSKVYRKGLSWSNSLSKVCSDCLATVHSNWLSKFCKGLCCNNADTSYNPKQSIKGLNIIYMHMYIEETCVENIFRFANSLALIFGRLHKMIKVIYIWRTKIYRRYPKRCYLTQPMPTDSEIQLIF